MHLTRSLDFLILITYIKKYSNQGLLVPYLLKYDILNLNNRKFYSQLTTKYIHITNQDKKKLK